MPIADSCGKFLFAFAVGLALGPGARADTDLSLFHLNDLGTLTHHYDDLYTATVGFSVTHGRFNYRLAENMFTDRTRGTRFDETHLTASTYLPQVGAWRLSAMAGGVRVGEGLLGESFQNWVHGLTKDDERVLTYVDDTSAHVVLGFEATHPYFVGPDVRVSPTFEVYDAFGFKSHAIAGVGLEWEVSRTLTVFGTAGARYSATKLAELEPWVNGLAPTGEIGFAYYGLVSLSYSYNAFGTEDHHWQLGLHFGF